MKIWIRPSRLLGISNCIAEEGAAEQPESKSQSQSQSATAEDDSVDTQFENELEQKLLDIIKNVQEVERQAGSPVMEFNRIRESLQKSKLDAVNRNTARANRMAEHMRTALRQLTQHEYGWMFAKPVDVQGFGSGYYEVIEKPMDLGKIRDRMNAEDGTGYKNIQEICADVRLVFSNAIFYNSEDSDVHHMAKTLSGKFEEKWKVVEQEEDARRNEDEANDEESVALHVAFEAATNNLIAHVKRQIEELNTQLEDLKPQVTPSCWTISTEEKRELLDILSDLPPENLYRIYLIISQKKSGSHDTPDGVEVETYALDPATLWRLHRYLRSVAYLQERRLPKSSPRPITTIPSQITPIPKWGAKKRRTR